MRPLLLLLALLVSTPLFSATVSEPKDFAVASAHPLATRAGIQILAQGGNAFDAAVAVAAMLGVVEPYSSGLGGGGFWLLHRASDNSTVMIDAREMAPGAASAGIYVDKDGKVNRDKAINTPLAAGIPGQAAAFDYLTKHYGKLPLITTLAPAIRAAQNGFPVNPVYETLATYRAPILQRSADSARIFLNDGQPFGPGTLIRQPDLAQTLKTLALSGADSFYSGPLAKKLVDGVRAGGGIWTLDDLAQYKVVVRKPVHFTYKDAEIWSAAPPSSGGVLLEEMFGMLSQFQLKGLSEADRTHLLIEVMRRAYRDRALYLGDPDFYPVPKKLFDPHYLEDLAADISFAHATPSSQLGKVAPPPSGNHTTHFSIIDKQGNYVAVTLSVNLPFGCGYTVPGTGVLLNDEMDDFSAQPGSPNAYGLVGSAANAIAPRKRPLSSMTPTFMEYGPKDNRQMAIVGTPGGSRIITMVFLALLEALDNKPPQAWVDRPRFHHQYLPDVVEYEPGAFSPELIKALEAKGHTLKSTGRHYGDMQVIRWFMNNGIVQAASDKRRLGYAQVGVKQ